MNNIYEQLNGKNLISQFQKFKASFQGDPRAEVQRLLDSGTISQEQFNRLAEQATQLQRLLKG